MQKTWVFDLGVIIVLWQYIGATIGQKVYLLKPFVPKLPLPLAQLCVQYDYVVKAKLWGNINRKMYGFLCIA